MKFFTKQAITSQLIAYLLLAYSVTATANEPVLRYRGQYTPGHEVNVFCPAISSQCYWLSPDTSENIRQQLKSLASSHTKVAYQPVCIVLTGWINQHSEDKTEIGFARDDAGLFTVIEVFGTCNQTGIVTRGDLQHHRWILESINGISIESGDTAAVLDFGEQMWVSGSTGCQQFAGHAVLRATYFTIDIEQSDKIACTAKQQKIASLLTELFNSEAAIKVDSQKNLILQNTRTQLKYILKDWVY